MIIDHPKPQVNLSHFSTLLFNCHVTQKECISSFIYYSIWNYQVFSIRQKTINLLEIIKVKPLKMFWLEKKTFRGEQKTSEKKRLSSSSLFISFSLYLNNKNGIWKDKAGTEQIANSSFVLEQYIQKCSRIGTFFKTVKKWGNHPIYVCSSFIKRTG